MTKKKKTMVPVLCRCCETKYLLEDYTYFLKTFAKSLGVVSESTTEEVLQNCLAKLEHLYQSTKIKIEHDDKNLLTTILNKLSEEISKLFNETNTTIKLDCISNVYILLNYFRALLNSKLPPIDRLTKVALKKKYCLEEKTTFEALLLSYKLQNDVYSDSKKTLSPFCGIITEHIRTLEEKDVDLGKYIAVRPENISYETIRKSITNGFSSILSPKRIMEIYTELNETVHSLLSTEILNSKNQISITASSLKSSLESFVNTLTSYRYLYPDIIEPLLCNVMQVMYGFKLKIELLKKLKLRHQHLNINIEKNLVKLVKLPSIDKEDHNYPNIISMYTSESMQNFLKIILKNDQFEALPTEKNFR